MRLLIFVAFCISMPCHGIDIRFERSINPFTRNVYYRYYLIERCQESIDLLKNNPNVWRAINFDRLALYQDEREAFKNDHVKETVKIVEKTHLIEPFLDLWHQIRSHRHIDDSSFHEDFVKLLFMLYKCLEQPPCHKAGVQNSTDYSIEKMLSNIDKRVDMMRPNNSKKSTSGHISQTYDATTDDIALNYYLIHRLDKAIQLLATAQQKLTSIETGFIDHAMCNMGINFSHERINYCFNQMTARKNLEPFLHTWQDFSRFRHAGDAHFLKEMLMMLFAVYKDLLLTMLTSESEKFITSEMDTILDLYEHVNELPLDDILHAIDLTTDKLLLLQSMEKKAKQGWKEHYPVVFHTLLALPIAYLMIKTCAL